MLNLSPVVEANWLHYLRARITLVLLSFVDSCDTNAKESVSQISDCSVTIGRLPRVSKRDFRFVGRRRSGEDRYRHRAVGSIVMTGLQFHHHDATYGDNACMDALPA